MSENNSPVTLHFWELSEAFVSALESFSEQRVVGSATPTEVFDATSVEPATHVAFTHAGDLPCPSEADENDRA